MKLLNVLNKLAFGELSQIAIGNSSGTGIAVENYPVIINHINMGLLEIYKRFNIKKRFVVIQQYDHIQTYHLDSLYATTNVSSTELYKYVTDSEDDPFLDDAIRIERVFSELGEEYVVNDDMDPESIHTPSQLSIQIALPDPLKSFMVEYRAMHPEIPTNLSVEAMAVYTIEMPATYLEALLAYVASRVFAPLVDKQSPVDESKNYMVKYELACQKIVELAIQNIPNNTKTNVRRNGWV